MSDIKVLQARKLRRLFLEYQEKQGGFPPAKDFADFLDINEKTLSALMNARNLASRETTYQICEKTGDWELCDILGYARPRSAPVPLSSLPPEFMKLLEEIDLEITNTIRERGITEYSAEAESIAREIMEKYGARVVSTMKSGSGSN